MQLATIQQQQTMTSREIAELTGKEHKNVMRDIREMIESIDGSNLSSAYKSTTYEGSNGQSYPQYELDKDLTLTLLTGYDAGARFKVVKRWQELEGPMTVERLLAQNSLAIQHLSNKVVVLEDKVEHQRPAVEFVEKYTKAENGSMNFRQVCKHLKANEARFREFLFDNEIMYRLAGNLMAHQNHIDAGRFEVTTDTFNNVITTKCHFTGKGVVWISEKWDKAKSQ